MISCPLTMFLFISFSHSPFHLATQSQLRVLSHLGMLTLKPTARPSPATI